MTLYLQILFESAWTASIIPFSTQATFYAMHAFGGYDMRLASAMLLAGAALGFAFNWWLGMQLARNRAKLSVTEAQYTLWQSLFRRYLLWILLFCFAPLCNWGLLAAGFLRIPARIALPLALLGQAGYIVWLFVRHSI